MLIARRGKLVARLVSVEQPEQEPKARIFGRFAGQVKIDPSFYDDMTEEDLIGDTAADPFISQ